jgi:hypothetical protein|tara:strand:- start:131 stop:991 length:861 start_codon:yes stop_codon:yes gene_type:complete
MSEINIPNIETDGVGIPNIQINGNGIKLVRPIGNSYVQDNRVWLITPPQAIPIAVPVTATIGTPVVNMPGCVKVSKENNYSSPNNRNKQLVDDDPKGNTVLCDAGAPYYEPANYDARELTWQTVYQNEPEVEGVDVGEPPTPEVNTPEPPPTNRPKEEVECPPINARRIGDLNAAGTERVKEYKLTPDKLICETIWEPVPTMEQFVPSIPVVSTTATIAAVATTSALLAKPLADLLLKVVKPVVKKAIAKVQKILGKTPPKVTRSDIVRDRYREKKGLPPLKVKKK